MYIYIEPHGCALSYGEAELMEREACKKALSIVEDPAEADLLVLHTCIVIESTERKMFTRIKKLTSLGKRLIVSGCLASFEPAKILELNPQATVLPTQKLDKFSEILDNLHLACQGKISKKRLRVYSTIPISTGCLGNCSFCIARIARGTLKSFSESYILELAAEALKRGAKELRLAAQDTASYGKDLGNIDLPLLLEKLIALEGAFRIRVGMMNVNTLLPIFSRLLEVYGDDKIYKFLHLPVQSGSQKILEKMNRAYTLENFKFVVQKFRARFPKSTISTDIIVGYPGESEEDYKLSIALVKEVKPDIINIKAFSPRAKTFAYNLKSRIDTKLVKQRTRALSKLALELSQANLKKYVGNIEKVLLTEKGKNNTTIGRTLAYKSVVLRENLRLGKFVEVKIISANKTYLEAKLL